MYKNFKTFREERELIEFGQKYDELCLAIVESGIPFDQFWQKHGLPFFISGVACNENQLLEGWNPSSWSLKGLRDNQNTGNGHEWETSANRKIVPPESDIHFDEAPEPKQPQKVQEAPPAPSWFKNVEQKPEMNAHTQKKVEEAVAEIRKQFAEVFTRLVKTFKKSDNKVGAQVAQRFYDKINSYIDASKVFSKGPMAQPTAGAQQEQI